jgi:hypothetical protein
MAHTRPGVFKGQVRGVSHQGQEKTLHLKAGYIDADFPSSQHFSLAVRRRTIHSASSMVQAFPGPQDVVGVRRWRVRCGLPTTRTQPPDPPKWQCTGSRATEKARSVRTDTLRLSGAETIAAEIRGENGATPSIRVRRACCTTHSGSCTCQAHPVGRVGLDNANPHCRN